MTEEDDVFLKIFNQKRDAADQCSEDDFEATMNFFEETAQAKQPFAAVDGSPVPSFADMESAMDAAVEDCVKRFAKDIYEHWKARRMATENHGLQPSLKVRVPSYCCIVDRADSVLRSLKPAKTRTIVIHMSVSVGARSGRFARLVAEMRRARRSCGVCARSWKMLGS